MHDKQIYLLRHGNTGFNKRYIGSSDVPVSPQGVLDVKESCDFLSSIDFDSVMCSPMKRCVQTLSYISTSKTVQYFDYLKEIDFGRWEKKAFADIVEEDKELVDSWAQNPDEFCFPEGECIPAFQNRILSAATSLYEVQAKRILVVSHGGIIRNLLCHLLRVPKEQYLLFDILPGCFSTIRLHEEGGVLTGLNLRG